MCFCLLMIACSKESTLESRINLDELYVIQDDPDDPVKHRIYEIYETYGIPVYFNDTIGRIFLKTDVHGQPVYQYEKLDLAWGYDSYKKLEYHYQYITDPEKQLEVLTWIGQYLRDADKALFPFCFFVPESVTTKNLDNREVTEVDYGKLGRRKSRGYSVEYEKEYGNSKNQKLFRRLGIFQQNFRCELVRDKVLVGGG